MEEFAPLIDGNVRLVGRTDYDFQGRRLSRLRTEARRDLCEAARRYTAQYRDEPAAPPDGSGPIFVAGHQPLLFHPGVWLKNFALGWLAMRHGARAVNLVIDSDTLKSAAVRVPGGTATEPRAAPIAFDRPGPPVPLEERPVVDRELFAAFGSRAAAEVASLVDDPMVWDYWPRAVARLGETGRLGASLAQSRHAIEGEWGLSTWEVPQARVCQAEPFAWFAAHLLAHLPRLRSVYNATVAEYRRANHIRSTAHPVPDLVQEGDWHEAPFWIWTAANPVRRRLFARQRGACLALSDRAGWESCISLGPEGDARRAVEQFLGLAERGVKIRSRALVTTLWARLALGDLFLHGIGGAKYDQVTNALCERFFGLRLPDYAVLSGTLCLAPAGQPSAADQLRTIEQQLRRLAYHPEQYLDDTLAAQLSRSDRDVLLAEKSRRIVTPQTRENGRARCAAIRRINTALQPWVAPRRAELAAEREAAAREAAAESILTWREYAFCLYPQKNLRNFFAGVLPKAE